MNLEQAKIENGHFVFGKCEYTLLQQAYCVNATSYAATAKKDLEWDDVDADTYYVCWQTTAEWDDHQASGTVHTRIGNDYSCNFCEDESNACDWENPVSVDVL